MALWSINERLAGRQGLDIEQPTRDWMVDLFPVDEEEEELVDEVATFAKIMGHPLQ